MGNILVTKQVYHMQSYINPFISNACKFHNWPKLLTLSTPKLVEIGYSSIVTEESIL
jgi:hypothetical protein